MHVLGIDIGTTSVKVVVLELESKEVYKACSRQTNANVRGRYSPELMMQDEQNVDEIVAAISVCLEEVLDEFAINNIKKLCICGQMHGVVLWNKDGAPGHLITWQDLRCDDGFLLSLPQSSSILSSGFGTVTLMWLSKNHPHILSKYEYAGTVMDYLTFKLCGLSEVVMSDQNAASWGYFDLQRSTWEKSLLVSSGWSSIVRFLPKIVPAGKTIAHINADKFLPPLAKGIPVLVAAGDLQCSSFPILMKGESCAVFNIGTSAQLVFELKDSRMEQPQVGELQQVGRLQVLPFFDGRNLLVAASLNGGNVVHHFVKTLLSWFCDLGLEVDEQLLWSRLTAMGNRAEAGSLEGEDVGCLKVGATIYGERHDRKLTGSVTSIRASEVPSLRQTVRAILRGIITNVSAMCPPDVLQSQRVGRLVLTGSMFRRFPFLAEVASSVFNVPIEESAEVDAAVGACLQCLHETVA